MSKSSKVIRINKLKANEDDITDPKEIANLLNKYFVNIGPSLAENLPIPNHDSVELQTERSQSFKFEQINCNIVEETIRKLSANKATGLDKLPASIFKLACNVISTPLSHIFNASISSGIFPDDWKVAKVLPKYKSKDRCDPRRASKEQHPGNLSRERWPRDQYQEDQTFEDEQQNQRSHHAELESGQRG
ncbi:hypothetical protein ACROYT_G038061 [Oculina patagonica]